MSTEREACTPKPLHKDGFNRSEKLPYGCEPKHIRAAMQQFIEFIGFVNSQLHTKRMPRLESFLMPANFSSIVGEFMAANIPKYCKTLAKNSYHNGHPDMLPAGMYERDALQHGQEGIEVKGSRYLKSWQGHNPENIFLMVFCFASSRPTDRAREIPPRPFRFVKVVAAQLKTSDWKFAGRSATSRRTITATVHPGGYEKMESNWIYRDPDVAALAAR